MFLRSIRVLLLSASVLCAFSAAAIAATMDYLGTWNSTATYAVGKVVVYNKAIYYSKLSTRSNPNRNRIPGSSTTYWEQVGTVGNTILSGVGNPTSASLGQVGDFYINTQTNTLFGPKTASQVPWPAGGISLVGPKGDAGSAAETGPEGPAGPQGETGPAGPQGGQGIQGVQGAQGEQGPEGPEGPQGATGPAGPQGPVGPQGSQGSQGAQGAKGDTGDKGDTGAKGDIGPMLPMQTLVDANGDEIGTMLQWGIVQVIDNGYPIAVQVDTLGFRLPLYNPNVAYGNVWRGYTTADCSGTAYTSSIGQPVLGTAIGEVSAILINANDQGTPYNTAPSVTVYYPQGPFQLRTLNSWIFETDGACRSATSYFPSGAWVGELKTKSLNFVAPFVLK